MSFKQYHARPRPTECVVPVHLHAGVGSTKRHRATARKTCRARRVPCVPDTPSRPLHVHQPPTDSARRVWQDSFKTERHVPISRCAVPRNLKKRHRHKRVIACVRMYLHAQRVCMLECLQMPPAMSSAQIAQCVMMPPSLNLRRVLPRPIVSANRAGRAVLAILRPDRNAYHRCLSAMCAPSATRRPNTKWRRAVRPPTRYVMRATCVEQTSTQPYPATASPTDNARRVRHVSLTRRFRNSKRYRAVITTAPPTEYAHHARRVAPSVPLRVPCARQRPTSCAPT